MTCHTSGGQKDNLLEMVVSFRSVSSRDLAQVLGLAASLFVHWAVSLAPILTFMYVSVPVCVCTCACECLWRNPLELEPEAVVGHMTWVLRTKCQSSGRTAKTLNH